MSLHFTIDAGSSHCRHLRTVRFVNPFRQPYLFHKPAHDYVATLHPCLHEGRDTLDRITATGAEQTDSQRNTTDRALLQQKLSTPWQNSSETQMLALFRGKVLWQAFIQPSSTTSLTLTVGTLGMAPSSVGLCLSATTEHPIHG